MAIIVLPFLLSKAVTGSNKVTFLKMWPAMKAHTLWASVLLQVLGAQQGVLAKPVRYIQPPAPE